MDLELVLVIESAMVVLGVVEMVLESCTGVVCSVGWLGLGINLGNGLAY